jgi:hypothetical protein
MTDQWLVTRLRPHSTLLDKDFNVPGWQVQGKMCNVAWPREQALLSAIHLITTYYSYYWHGLLAEPPDSNFRRSPAHPNWCIGSQVIKQKVHGPPGSVLKHRQRIGPDDLNHGKCAVLWSWSSSSWSLIGAIGSADVGMEGCLVSPHGNKQWWSTRFG